MVRNRDAQEGAEILSAELDQAHDILAVVQQLSAQTDEIDRRLHEEYRLHSLTKDRARQAEEDLETLRQTLEKERQEMGTSKARIGELRQFQQKSGVALKAMADDLMAVRLQNEALQAEMDVQRKAFVVSVNWAQVHGELKAKADTLENEHEQLQAKHMQIRQSLESTIAAQEESKRCCVEVQSGIEKAKQELAKTEELAKSARLAADLAEQLGGYDELKKLVDGIRERRKKQREAARAAMEKTLRTNENFLGGMTFAEWRRVARAAKLAANKKKQNQGLAMRSIANSSQMLLDISFHGWRKEWEEVRRKRILEANRALEGQVSGVGQQADNARRKALAQLEKTFGNEQKALLRDTYMHWHLVRYERVKRERAHAIAARSIASNGAALLQQVFLGWSDIWRRAKRNREIKARGQAKAVRMMTDAGNALLDFCLTAWHKLTAEAKAVKRAKEGSNTKALRMIASSAEGLRAQAFVSWRDLKRKHTERDKKMKAIERGLISSGNGLCQYIMHHWNQLAQKTKKAQAKKNVGMQHSLKKIKRMMHSALLESYSAWATHTAHMKHLRIMDATEAKAKKASEPDEKLLANMQEIEDLKQMLQEMQQRHQVVLEEARVAEQEASETNSRLEEVERSLNKSTQELMESRAKAKDINEELLWRRGSWGRSVPNDYRVNSAVPGIIVGQCRRAAHSSETTSDRPWPMVCAGFQEIGCSEIRSPRGYNAAGSPICTTPSPGHLCLVHSSETNNANFLRDAQRSEAASAPELSG
eukprot:TRINITY_DN21529_c1_g1_i1.p1 TRINITY_DN21529_c1_g1~~TRINITY_DN21529_c1_g1_i1.p1  ORF type:complete len:763 (+),score=224.25 TRINITY_DN21529_c1_g1_i1:222-2510(+)